MTTNENEQLERFFQYHKVLTTNELKQQHNSRVLGCYKRFKAKPFSINILLLLRDDLTSAIVEYGVK